MLFSGRRGRADSRADSRAAQAKPFRPARREIARHSGEHRRAERSRAERHQNQQPCAHVSPP